MKKSLKTFAATVGLLAALSCPALADTTTNIYFNDTLLHTTEPVINQNGTTLLAFRDLFQCINGEVTWNDTTRTATAKYGNTTVELYPDTGAVKLNGSTVSVAVGPQILNNRVYVPLRFVAQSLGTTVDYTQANGVGTIRLNNAAQQATAVTPVKKQYATKSGTILTVQRDIKPQKNKNTEYRYIMTDPSTLMEIVSTNGFYYINKINLEAGKTDSAKYTFKSIDIPSITSIVKNGQLYTCYVNDDLKTETSLVGYYDAEEMMSDEFAIKSVSGALYVYRTLATRSFMKIDGVTGTGTAIDTDEKYDLVMDFKDRLSATSGAGYIVLPAKNGSIDPNSRKRAYLADNNLVLLSESNLLVADLRLTTDMVPESWKLWAVDNGYVVTSFSDYYDNPELNAIGFDLNGEQVFNYTNISKLGENRRSPDYVGYHTIEVVDSLQDGNMLYFILKTDKFRCYIQYDAVANTSVTKRFAKDDLEYETLLYTPDGVKMIASDADHYYIRDFE